MGIIPFYSTREHNSNDFGAKHFSRSTFTLLFLTNFQLVIHSGQPALKPVVVQATTDMANNQELKCTCSPARDYVSSYI